MTSIKKPIYKKIVLDTVLHLKKDFNLEVIDTHLHPFDVMGVVPFSEYEHIEDRNLLRIKNENRNYDAEKILNPNILERFDYGSILLSIAKMYSVFFPDSFSKDIISLYGFTGNKRLFDEMDMSLVDKSVFLPVEPWSMTDDVANCFDIKNNFILGSFDIHNTSIEDIYEKVDYYVKKYNIIGIKLHPNLQDFYPQPSHNISTISDKLKLIYSLCDEYNLYLLFHCGISYFSNSYNSLYDKNYGRSKNKALLSNFIDSDGNSEIFGKYKMPIILAHLANYGSNRLQYFSIDKLVKLHDSIFFDTAGVSTSLLRDMLNVVSSKRVIFGSDAFYNGMLTSIVNIYKAIYNNNYREDKQEMFSNILGRNFSEQILRRGRTKCL